MPTRSTDRIGRAGEHYVAAELNRRGAYASPFSGNVPEIDILATDDSGERVAHIQVKTKRAGNWHMGLRHGWSNITLYGCPKDDSCSKECTPNLCDPIKGKENHYWVFVALQTDGGPNYHVVPDEKVRSLLRENHTDYLDRNCGQRRGKNHDSMHFIFRDSDLSPWKNKWEQLGLGLSSYAE